MSKIQKLAFAGAIELYLIKKLLSSHGKKFFRILAASKVGMIVHIFNFKLVWGGRVERLCSKFKEKNLN